MIRELDIFSLFTVPETTKAGYSFADIPVRISFKESHAAIYGVPLDITTSFGKGTSRGPEAIRRTSARQIETFMLDEKADIHDLIGIFDLGDLRLPKTKSSTKMLDHLMSAIPKVVASLRNDSKIPVMLHKFRACLLHFVATPTANNSGFIQLSQFPDEIATVQITRSFTRDDIIFHALLPKRELIFATIKK